MNFSYSCMYTILIFNDNSVSKSTLITYPVPALSAYIYLYTYVQKVEENI